MARLRNGQPWTSSAAAALSAGNRWSDDDANSNLIVPTHMGESGTKRPANPLQRASYGDDSTDAAFVLVKGNFDGDCPGCPTDASNAVQAPDIVQEAKSSR